MDLERIRFGRFTSNKFLPNIKLFCRLPNSLMKPSKSTLSKADTLVNISGTVNKIFYRRLAERCHWQLVYFLNVAVVSIIVPVGSIFTLYLLNDRLSLKVENECR